MVRCAARRFSCTVLCVVAYGESTRSSFLSFCGGNRQGSRDAAMPKYTHLSGTNKLPATGAHICFQAKVRKDRCLQARKAIDRETGAADAELVTLTVRLKVRRNEACFTTVRVVMQCLDLYRDEFEPRWACLALFYHTRDNCWLADEPWFELVSPPLAATQTHDLAYHLPLCNFHQTTGSSAHSMRRARRSHRRPEQLPTRRNNKLSHQSIPRQYPQSQPRARGHKD